VKNRRVEVRIAKVGLAAALGFGYAAWRAEIRLARELPREWEGRDIVLTGTVRGLPMRDARGVRFAFDVESTSPYVERFPDTVQLTWFSFGGHTSLKLAPGERRTLVARLKRTHGNANFYLPDTEARLLERGIRAVGYVRSVRRAGRVDSVSARVGREGRGAPDMLDGSRVSLRGALNAVDRARDAIRQRIVDVLGLPARGVAAPGNALSAWAKSAPHTGIVIALAIGAQDAISEEDWQRLRRTGTNHLMAISGLHIGSIAALAAALVAALWRRGFWLSASLPLRVPVPLAASFGGVLAAAAYAALAGLGIPAQRTLTMLIVATLAFATGRRVDSLLVLAWALAIVVLVDPWATLSASTALSFGAVAAIVFALKSAGRIDDAPPDDEPDWPSLDPSESALAADRGDAATLGDAAESALDRLRRRLAPLAARTHDFVCDLPGKVAAAARVQWAVTIGLAPLTVLWFSQMPLVGPPANAIAIPWVSALVVPCVLIAIALPAPLDAYALHLAHRLVEWLFAVLDVLGAPTWAVQHLPAPGPVALTFALAGVAWMLAPRGWPLRFAAPILWLPLVWPASRAPLDDAFRVTALDVGQGTSVLVETAHRRLLFDAGPGPEAGNAGQRIVAPFLLAHGANMLDMLVVSHRDADHAGGAPAVLADIATAQMRASLPAAHPLWVLARHAGASLGACRSGERWQWDGVMFEFLWPDGPADPRKPNATACVLRVSNAQHAVLIASDIERAAEYTLVSRDRQALASDVLIVPHHGSKTSSTEAFLDSVRPRVSIFQVGYRNRFNHPHPLVAARYRVRGVDMLRSDDDGAIRIDSDGATLIVDAYRSTHRRYWMGR
jgi:competence protein ComEC